MSSHSAWKNFVGLAFYPETSKQRLLYVAESTTETLQLSHDSLVRILSWRRAIIIFFVRVIEPGLSKSPSRNKITIIVFSEIKIRLSHFIVLNTVKMIWHTPSPLCYDESSHACKYEKCTLTPAARRFHRLNTDRIILLQFGFALSLPASSAASIDSSANAPPERISKSFFFERFSVAAFCKKRIRCSLVSSASMMITFSVQPIFSASRRSVWSFS